MFGYLNSRKDTWMRTILHDSTLINTFIFAVHVVKMGWGTLDKIYLWLTMEQQDPLNEFGYIDNRNRLLIYLVK